MTSNSFHEKAREALKKHLENVLSYCVIDKGFVNFDRGKDEDLYKFINEVKKHKKAWMRDIDIYDLLYQEVSSYLTKRIEKRWEATSDLKHLVEDKGIGEITNAIITYLESIPRKYSIYFELPSVKGIGIKEIKLTDDISFVERVSDTDFSDIKIPARSLGEAYSLNLREHGINKGRLYIRILSDGYTDGTLDSSAVKRAYSKFKQVVLLAKLSGLLKEGAGKVSLGLLGIVFPRIFAVHSIEPNIEQYLITPPKTVSDYISKLMLNEDILNPTELEIFSEKFENKIVPTPNDKALILEKRLQHAVKLLKTSDNDNDAESIKTAIEWVFESLTNDNDTISFIYACIGLEAILGDDYSRQDTTKTLADRSAYLLGNNFSNRKQLRKRFEELYGIRSDLIHGRKARLDEEQLEFLRFAQIMLDKVIWKEISYVEQVTNYEGGKETS